jgi:hypothetical protein
MATNFFNLATITWRNDGCGPVTKSTVQLSLLNLLTAHLAALYAQSQGDQSPGSAKDANSPVGRISAATEGSISIQTDLGATPTSSANQQWLSQTKYGLQFWAMTSQYRTAHYVPGALQSGGPGYGFGPGFNYGVGRGGRSW